MYWGVRIPVMAALAILLGSSISNTAIAGGMPAQEGDSAVKAYVRGAKEDTALEQALEEIAAEKEVQIMEMAPPATMTAPKPAEPMKLDLEVAKGEKESTFEPAPRWRFVERVPNSSFLGLSIGFYDAFDDETAGIFNIEWQPGWRIARIVQPMIGGFATSDGSLFGYAGLAAPMKLGKRILIRPSFAGGAYKEGGGVDLGKSFLWRGGLEMAYEFDDRSRLGIEATVLTNGESSDDSDRTETIMLKYTVPMEKLEGMSFRK